MRSYAKLVFCDDPVALASAVTDGAATAIITEWRDGAGSTIESTVRSMRSEYPNIPVLVYAPLTPEGAHDMLAAARAGAVDVIIANFDDVGITLGRRLAAAQATTLSDRIVERLATLVPLPVAQMLEVFLPPRTHATLGRRRGGRAPGTPENVGAALRACRTAQSERVVLLGAAHPHVPSSRGSRTYDGARRDREWDFRRAPRSATCSAATPGSHRRICVSAVGVCVLPRC